MFARATAVLVQTGLQRLEQLVLLTQVKFVQVVTTVSRKMGMPASPSQFVAIGHLLININAPIHKLRSA
jgi:hypothetical protein